MHLVLICGSLEAGRDGVGDYCRMLAGAWRESGGTVALLAINDALVDSSREVVAEGGAILRLARGEPWDSRRDRAAEFLAAQRPDWVSVQFVGYALDPNGVVFRWGPRLAELLRGRRVHLNFHELWIGDSTEYGLADRLRGAVQRAGIRRFVRSLRPAAVHTTCRVYQQLLAGIGVKAGRLGLPGNIPLTLGGGNLPVPELDAFAGPERWRLGVFGTIHPRWRPEPWLGELAAVAGRKLVLVQFGEAGARGREIWERMADAYRDRADFVACGPREGAGIAAILARVDAGIATSPWALIEKSGSTAAFLDRGLPVLVPRDDWKLRAGFTPEPAGDPLLFKSSAALLHFLRAGSPPMPRLDKLPEIARHLRTRTACAGVRLDF